MVNGARLPRELAFDDANRPRERTRSAERAHRVLDVVEETKQKDHIESPELSWFEGIDFALSDL